MASNTTNPGFTSFSTLFSAVFPPLSSFNYAKCFNIAQGITWGKQVLMMPESALIVFVLGFCLFVWYLI